VAQPSLFTGELTQAREHFEQSLSLYDSARHRPLTRLYGLDPGVAGHAFLSLTLWFLGYPELALKRSQESRHLAREVSHAHGQALALQWAATLHQLRREWQQVRELSESLTALAAEQGLAMWLAWGRILSGWAMAEQGQAAEAIDQMRRGMDAFNTTGSEMFRPYHHLLLAEAYAKAGQVSGALTVLDEAQALIERNGERIWEAELYRMKGELLVSQGAAASEVEPCFRHAIEIAMRQQAKSLELRAVMSLSRLWRGQHKQEEARQMLAETYGWFTEGFGTTDLIEANGFFKQS
jgi:predicted ATPase